MCAARWPKLICWGVGLKPYLSAGISSSAATVSFSRPGSICRSTSETGLLDCCASAAPEKACEKANTQTTTRNFMLPPIQAQRINRLCLSHNRSIENCRSEFHLDSGHKKSLLLRTPDQSFSAHGFLLVKLPGQHLWNSAQCPQSGCSNPFWFNTSSFDPPPPGQFGNLGFNALRGPGRQNWNLSLFKEFMLNESRGTRFELRADAFNTWNHTQFRGDVNTGGISRNVGAGDFGAITNAFDPREFQLGAKLVF